jgi:hypothetical protein
MEISGTVTYDGQAVADGTISFQPADGKGPTAAGNITEGHYKLKIAPGSKRVEINGYRTTGKQRYNPADPNSPMINIRQPILPERFNAKTQLTRDITTAASVYDFTLEKTPADRPK